MQRRADLRLVNKRFGDVNSRIDCVEQRFDALEYRVEEVREGLSAKVVDLGREVSALQGRVGEVGSLISALLQTLLGGVVIRRGGEDHRKTAMEQAAFAESDPAKD